MKVDVRLCGAIPRSEWITTHNPEPGAHLTSSTPSYLAATNALANAPTGIGSKNDTTIQLPPPHGPPQNVPPHPNTLSSSQFLSSHDNNNPSTLTTTLNDPTALMPLLEPPSWAVPASGEARLEPVCEALGKHEPVDLTARSFYRIGRSPASDVQLLHGTSSRRHAMIFHHPNGSCYIVDCGSAHGTFVNGQRIVTKTTGGWVVPHKVRRGSLIRFGGPGAPAFVLKSFAIGFSAMVSLDEEDEEMEVPHQQHSIVSKPPVNSKWLVQVNTRLNALGGSGMNGGSALSETSANVVKPTKRSITVMSTSSIPAACCSFDDDQNDTLQEPCSKRARCMSPPVSPESPIRLVSPDANHTSGTITTTSLLLKHRTTTTTMSQSKRVHFQQDLVQPFYPALVSPEELSDNEDTPLPPLLPNPVASPFTPTLPSSSL